MLHIQRLRNSIHIAPVLLAIAAVIVVVAGFLIVSRPADIIGSAEARETAAVVDRAGSWADEWYDVQRSLPRTFDEDVQAF